MTGLRIALNTKEGRMTGSRSKHPLLAKSRPRHRARRLRLFLIGTVSLTTLTIALGSVAKPRQILPEFEGGGGGGVATDQVPEGSNRSTKDLAKRVADLEDARLKQERWISNLVAELRAVKEDLATLKKARAGNGQ